MESLEAAAGEVHEMSPPDCALKPKEALSSDTPRLQGLGTRSQAASACHQRREQRVLSAEADP